MSVLLWILVALLLLLVALLLTPVVLEVDTRTAQAEVRWGWVGGFRVLVDDGPLRYRARVLFVPWERPFIFEREQKERATTAIRKPRGPMSPERRRWLLQAGWKALRATHVRRFRLRLDTNDAVLNAWLFPVLHLWRLRGFDVAVRFTGGTELAIAIDHSAARILWAVLRT